VSIGISLSVERHGQRSKRHHTKYKMTTQSTDVEGNTVEPIAEESYTVESYKVKE